MTVDIVSVPNLRDLGGLLTADGGRTRAGLLFRSTELNRLSDTDLPKVEALGISTIVDLRTTAERATAPDRAIAGAREVVLDVLADAPTSAAAAIPQLLNNPVQTLASVNQQDVANQMEAVYRDLVLLPSSIAGYASVVRTLADVDALPLLFHCTTGKDRTGWGAAIALSILGVDRSTIERDYLQTNTDLLPAMQPFIDSFTVAGGDPAVLRTILGVRAEFLAAAFDQADESYGSMDGYLTGALGVDEPLHEQICSAITRRFPADPSTR